MARDATPTPNDIQRLFGRADIGFDCECWDWQGSLDRDGYAKFRIGPRHTLAHRAAYEVSVGEPQYTIDHLCRNRACINPRHMEDVPIGTNAMRGESPPAHNRRKTECKRGHLFDGGNTYIHPKRGHRICRTCQRGAVRQYRERKSQ